MDNMSLSDIAAIVKDNDGLGSSAWLIILFVLIFGFGGNGLFGRNNSSIETNAATNEILLGQKFDSVMQSLNKIGDGICSSTLALKDSITADGRVLQTQIGSYQLESQKNIDSLRFDMAAGNQKILDALAQSKIDSMAARINQLEMQNAMSGVVKYPQSTVYSSGSNPFCGCNSVCPNV